MTCSALAFAVWAYSLRQLPVTQVAVAEVRLLVGGLGPGQLVGGSWGSPAPDWLSR